MSIVLRDVKKRFGSFQAIRGVSFDIRDGELIALLGPSGCGKTTLLRLIAGLESADGGSIEIDHAQPAEGDDDRPVGFVFQHYALFRHMTVFENVAFGLRVVPRRQRLPKDAIADRVHRLLQLVQLDTHARRFPNELSGGQRQRVALARALAVQPRILLLDEPFGALDARVRAELRRWLRTLHDEIHVTSVLVTHDQEEALEVADRVVIMNEGGVEQIGTPDEVFHDPKTEFVIRFLGSVNQFHGRVAGGKAWFGNLGVDVPQRAGEARLLVRPHELQVSLESSGSASIPATVTRINSAGRSVRLELRGDGDDRLDAEISPDEFASLHVEKGARVYVTPRELRVFAH